MNKLTSRTILASGSLALFSFGFYVGHEMYGRNSSENSVYRIESVLHMGNSSIEEKEAWILSALAKDIDQRAPSQSQAAICKLLATKVAKMKEGHAVHVEIGKRFDNQPGAETEAMYESHVAGAEQALNESGCP
jgi:hypothetical protein